MTLQRTLRIAAKDLRLGPRSPIFAWAILLPLLMTFLIQTVFGTLFEPTPRLAVVDPGNSVITQQLVATEGIEIEVLPDETALQEAVAAHDFDAGLVLAADFDEELTAGARPPLEFFISGESLASTRVVLSVTTLDAINSAAGEPLAEVVVTPIGDEDYLSLETRLLPLVVIYAVVIAALFLPAASLVQEREQRTLDAVLVTPARMTDVLAGKAVLGVVLAMLMGWVTLALNDAFSGQPVAVSAFLLLGSVMLVEIGLILGCWAKDSNALFSAVKAGGILIVAPVVFFLFPDLPQWIGQLFPTYYFLSPIFEMATSGTSFVDHWVEMMVGIGVVLVLLPAVSAVGRRAERLSAVNA